MIAKMVLLPMMPTTLSLFAITRMLCLVGNEVKRVSRTYFMCGALPRMIQEKNSPQPHRAMQP